MSLLCSMLPMGVCLAYLWFVSLECLVRWRLEGLEGYHIDIHFSSPRANCIRGATLFSGRVAKIA